MYIIITGKEKAAMRHSVLTSDLQLAGHLPEGVDYVTLIEHPTEDKAAIVWENQKGEVAEDGTILIKPIIYDGFFTDQEKDAAIDVLPEDWNETEEETE